MVPEGPSVEEACTLNFEEPDADFCACASEARGSDSLGLKEDGPGDRDLPRPFSADLARGALQEGVFEELPFS